MLESQPRSGGKPITAHECGLNHPHDRVRALFFDSLYNIPKHKPGSLQIGRTWMQSSLSDTKGKERDGPDLIILTLSASSRATLAREHLTDARHNQIISISAFSQFSIISINRRSLARGHISLTARGHPQTLKVSLQAFQSLMNPTFCQLPNEAHKSIPFLSLTVICPRIPLRPGRDNFGQSLGSQKITLWLKKCFPVLLTAR